MTSTTNDQADVRRVIGDWHRAIVRGDLEGVVAAHTDDIVMFDVPPPDDGVRGLDAYRETWPPFFEWQQRGASFEIVELDVTTDDDVALRAIADRPVGNHE
jgi:ketosteroid isomerase-like protein